MPEAKMQTPLIYRRTALVNDNTICKGDYVRFDGWRWVRDEELLYAVMVEFQQSAHKPFGMFDAECGDWVVLDGESRCPQLVKLGDFSRRFEPAGFYEEKQLYRRRNKLKVFEWQGPGVLKIYPGETPEGVASTVQPGDYVLEDEETRTFRRVSRGWALKHYAAASPPSQSWASSGFPLG